jgi:hypothetical protein
MPVPSTIDVAGKTIEDYCDLALAGKLYPEICDLWGVTAMSLMRWLHADPLRAARAKEAKAWAAEHYDHDALADILNARTSEELAKAREAAHHRRWRAKMMARGTYLDYSQKDVDPKDDSTVTIQGGLPD